MGVSELLVISSAICVVISAHSGINKSGPILALLLVNEPINVI